MLSESTADEAHRRTGGPAFWYRLTDNLFRRLAWWLLPVVAFTGLGFFQANRSQELYESDATLSANENPLVGSPDLPGAMPWYETPATVTSRVINEQLRTDTFIDAIATSTGLDDAIDNAALARETIRSNIWAYPTGNGIFSVDATWADPQTSYALVSATIAGYQDYITEIVASNAAEAEEFYSQQLDVASEERAAAERDLEEFIERFAGDAAADDQPLNVQIQVDRLGDRVDAAEAKVSATQTSIEEAQLQVAQQTTRAGRSFSVIDQPSVPVEPVSRLMDYVVTIGSFFVLGLVIAGAGLLITTALDRSITSAGELLAFDVVTLVATVPKISLAATARHRGAAHTKQRRRTE